MGKRQNCSTSESRLSQILKLADIFALPLGFAYKRQLTYKSASGGIFSVFTLFLILAYFIYLASDVWNFKVDIKNSLVKRDLVNDNTTIHLTPEVFEFAFSIGYTGFNLSILPNIHQFVSFHVDTVRGFWNETDDGPVYAWETGTRTLERCHEGIFNNDTEYLDKLKIPGNYFCVQDSQNEYDLQGSPSSEEFSFFALNVRECNQAQLDRFQEGEVCAQLDEQMNVASQINLNIIFMNQYFSGENEQNPIQQDYKFLTYMTPYNTSQQSFTRVGMNYAILEDSWFFSSYHVQNASYTTTRIDYQYNRNYLPYSPFTPFISVLVFLDENVHINQRSAFNIIHAIQSIGGFASVVMIAAKIIFYFIQHFNYTAAMISKLYSTQKAGKEDGEDRQREKQFEESQREFQTKCQPLKKGSLVLGDLECISEQQSKIEELTKKFSSFSPLNYSFFEYLKSFCRNSSKKKLFASGKYQLYQEINISRIIKKLRIFDLYLNMRLNPFQKNILKAMTKQLPLETFTSKEAQTRKASCSQFEFIEAQPFQHSLQQLISAQRNGETSQLSQKLASHLGIVYADESGFQKRKKSKNKHKNKLESARELMIDDSHLQSIQSKQEQFGLKEVQRKRKSSKKIKTYPKALQVQAVDEV